MREAFVVVLWLLATYCRESTAASIYYTVNQDGHANFTSIAAALAAIPANSTTRHTIIIYPGTYNEKLSVTAAMGPVTLQGIGSSNDSVLIRNSCAATGDGTVGCSNCTGGQWSSETLYVALKANDFIARNISIANDACNYDHYRARQSFAIQTRGDRCSLFNVRLYGSQDTFYTGGTTARIYFHGGFVNGSVDPIFGYGAAYFKNTEISIETYYTAHMGDAKLGTQYVFDNCQVTKPNGTQVGKTYLGRPWGSRARVIFKNCFMDDHIIPAGWYDWKHNCSTTNWCANVTYAEFNSSGPGAAPSSRVEWSSQLTDAQLENFTMNVTLRGWAVPDDVDDIPDFISSEIALLSQSEDVKGSSQPQDYSVSAASSLLSAFVVFPALWLFN